MNRRAYLLAAITVLLAWLFHSRSFGAPIFPVDDAYITLHNAQVLHWGRDPNYPGTPALAGATSPIHLSLVALLMFVLPPRWALDASLWIGILLYALALVHLARVHRAGPVQTALLVLVGLCIARTPHHLLNGLETGLALAGLTWALGFAAKDKPGRALPTLCGLLPFLRPEFAAASLLLLAVQGWRRGQNKEVRAFVGDLAVACACAAPWLLWIYADTGAFLPATVGAKRAFFSEAGLPAEVKIAWLSKSLRTFVFTAGALVLFLPALFASLVGRACVAFCVVFVAAYYVQFPGAISHYEQRYAYAAFLPVLLYGAASVLCRQEERSRRMAAILLALTAFQASLFAPFWWREQIATREFTRHELGGVAVWSHRNIPPGATVLIHDAGYISYASRLHLVDFVGLKTPWAVPYHLRLTFPTVGVRRVDAIHEIALRARPEYLIVLQGWDSIFQITKGLSGQGWRLDPLRTSGAYRVYRLHPPIPSPGAP